MYDIFTYVYFCRYIINIHSDFLSQRVHMLFLSSSAFTGKLHSLNVLVDSRLVHLVSLHGGGDEQKREEMV